MEKALYIGICKTEVSAESLIQALKGEGQFRTRFYPGERGLCICLDKYE